MAAMRLPLWMKVAWSVWVAVWVPVYWKQYGTQNFLYFCDLGNLFVLAGLWLESRLLFSWQAAGLLLFQTLFIIDLAGALATGRHLIGGTEYLFDPNLSLFVRGLSLFHVAMPRTVAVGHSAAGLRRAGMAIPNSADLGGGPAQLFLAAAVRCELGSRIVLAPTAHRAWTGLSRGLFGGGAARGLLANPQMAAMVVERLAIAKRDVSFFRESLLRAGRVRNPAHAPLASFSVTSISGRFPAADPN